MPRRRRAHLASDVVIDQIRTWMCEHGASSIVDTLAPPANEELLAAAEREVGPLPAALKDLYRLHDGQQEERGCFIEAQAFLGVQWALDMHDTLLGIRL